MTEVYLSLGSNIDPEVNISRAVVELKKKIDVLSISTVYQTEPLGVKQQPDYYNCVLKAETLLDARTLKYDVLRVVELSLGRQRTEDRYAPRTIDIDILLFGRQTVDEQGLRVPDPDIMNRPFLSLALSELSPDLKLPGSCLPVSDLRAGEAKAGIYPLTEFTSRLRAIL